jgi:acetolactate synthase-1/2/3 large subunit
LAQNGRPGPVLIDIPKDVGLEETVEYSYQKIADLFKKNNYRTEHYTKRENLDQFVETVNDCFCPLLYVGGGVVRMVLKHYNSWRNFSTTSNDHFNGKKFL